MADIESRVTSVESRVNELDGRVTRCEDHITDFRRDCDKDMTNLQCRIDEKIELLIKNSDTIKMILLYVVLPLIVILGGLVGIKIVWPSGG